MPAITFTEVWKVELSGSLRTIVILRRFAHARTSPNIMRRNSGIFMFVIGLLLLTMTAIGMRFGVSELSVNVETISSQATKKMEFAFMVGLIKM